MGGWGYSNKSKILQISNHFDLQHFDLFEIISYIPQRLKSNPFTIN